jgi:predicted transcriptional regulator
LLATLVLSLVHYRRTQIETICDVLELCSKGTNKHGIVYNAELTTKTLNKYLNMLSSSGFVTPRVVYNAKANRPTVKVVYETTETGTGFLERCLNLLAMLGKAGKTKVKVKPLDRALDACAT